MIALLLAAAAPSPHEFGVRMEEYLACLRRGLPADMGNQDRQTRARLYRIAAAKCTSERQAAIDAAVREREPGTSPEAARALAVDIIDTLDPLSNSKYGK